MTDQTTPDPRAVALQSLIQLHQAAAHFRDGHLGQNSLLLRFQYEAQQGFEALGLADFDAAWAAAGGAEPPPVPPDPVHHEADAATFAGLFDAQGRPGTLTPAERDLWDMATDLSSSPTTGVWSLAPGDEPAGMGSARVVAEIDGAAVGQSVAVCHFSDHARFVAAAGPKMVLQLLKELAFHRLPPLIVTSGNLADGAEEKIREFIESHRAGASVNEHRVLMIEANVLDQEPLANALRRIRAVYQEDLEGDEAQALADQMGQIADIVDTVLGGLPLPPTDPEARLIAALRYIDSVIGHEGADNGDGPADEVMAERLERIGGIVDAALVDAPQLTPAQADRFVALVRGASDALPPDPWADVKRDLDLMGLACVTRDPDGRMVRVDPQHVRIVTVQPDVVEMIRTRIAGRDGPRVPSFEAAGDLAQALRDFVAAFDGESVPQVVLGGLRDAARMQASGDWVYSRDQAAAVVALRAALSVVCVGGQLHRGPLRPDCPHNCDRGCIETDGPGPDETHGYPCPHCDPVTDQRDLLRKQVDGLKRQLADVPKYLRHRAAYVRQHATRRAPEVNEEVGLELDTIAADFERGPVMAHEDGFYGVPPYMPPARRIGGIQISQLIVDELRDTMGATPTDFDYMLGRMRDLGMLKVEPAADPTPPPASAPCARCGAGPGDGCQQPGPECPFNPPPQDAKAPVADPCPGCGDDRFHGECLNFPRCNLSTIPF